MVGMTKKSNQFPPNLKKTQKIKIEFELPFTIIFSQKLRRQSARLSFSDGHKQIFGYKAIGKMSLLNQNKIILCIMHLLRKRYKFLTLIFSKENY